VTRVQGFRFPNPVYPIVDAGGAAGRTHLELADAVLAAGAPLLQLRVKGASTRAFVEIARAVKAAADRAGAMLIVNDRADVAHLVDAAGVHLGQTDLPPSAARAILGPQKIVGFSTHSTAQAEAALQEAAIDYLAFGPVFPTRSKENPDPVQGVEVLRAVRGLCRLPLVAIGGIDGESLPAVLAAGADAAAVIGAIAGATDPTAATRRLLAIAAEPR
jgi:thiamine-phosphate pyrophosphorylase